MKIIEDTVWLELRCDACGVLFQAEPDDVTSRPNIDYEGDEVGRIPVVECPKCGKQHDIPSAKVTAKIRKIAETKHKKKDD